MVKLVDSGSENMVKVNRESELLVCLCKPSCEGHISLEGLQEQLPGLNISLRIENGNE